MFTRPLATKSVPGWLGAAALFALAVSLVGGCGRSPTTDGAAAASEIPGQYVKIARDRRIYLKCSGQGSPTVLLEGGYAATSQAWYKVQPVIARKTRVCSYDRAGYGDSDMGPLPRDGAAVAQDLDATLRRAMIHGPFVLVGHSAGGLYVRLFSDLRPDDVVGMVLVDPSVEHQDRRLAVYFGPNAGSLAPQRERSMKCLAALQRHALPSTDPALKTCTPAPDAAGHVDAASLRVALRPETWKTQISEAETLWGSTSDEIDAGRRTYGDMPIIVLTADGTYANVPDAARKPVDSVWLHLHDEIAARSSRGTSRVVTGTSHMMMFDRPDAIEAAVDEVIAQSRK